jgi:vacuolar-type H+-ATPase subunit E/Vma4
MSKVPRHQFPNAAKATTTPDWLNPRGASGDGVRTLVSVLQGDPQPPARSRDEPTRPTPPPSSPPEPDFDPEPEPEMRMPARDQPVDQHMSRLPGPPRLGSLLPGGRSQPPPANDRDEGMHERIQAFANAAIELAIARTATLALMEGQLLDLAVEIAETLIERDVESNHALHATLARAALQTLGSDATNVTLRTSHDGYAAITDALGGDEVEVRGVKVHVVADMAIPGLGCVVDGDNVRVDATVGERLRAVRRAFEEERRRAQENVE